jgi:hypothetical protein
MRLRREVLSPRHTLRPGEHWSSRQPPSMGVMIVVLCALIGIMDVVSRMHGVCP